MVKNKYLVCHCGETGVALADSAYMLVSSYDNDNFILQLIAVVSHIKNIHAHNMRSSYRNTECTWNAWTTSVILANAVMKGCTHSDVRNYLCLVKWYCHMFSDVTCATMWTIGSVVDATRWRHKDFQTERTSGIRENELGVSANTGVDANESTDSFGSIDRHRLQQQLQVKHGIILNTFRWTRSSGSDGCGYGSW